MEMPLNIMPLLQNEMTSVDGTKKRFGFEGAFGKNFVTPRTINSSYIGKMVCCQGIVTSVSLIRPKISKSIHFDETKKQFFEKEYRDRTMLTLNMPTTTKYPLNHEGNFLRSEYGLSEYFDFQTFILQEMPENAPAGQLPRSIECILSEDLVDKVKPGDRVDVFGIYKSFTKSTGSEFPSQFKTLILTNNVKHKKTAVFLQKNSLERLQMVAESSIKFNSVAPTIFGHDVIKKALAMQMVGGNEILLENGAKIRGDINILLIGDPSTAKSQMLRYVLNFMPLTIATTGKGSTGVGLTAAVVFDPDTNDKRLEAGAMVLGDRGVVCIDEFDKMNDDDRVAIHEVMEQQTVTIAKSGIHTTLNARCSVLAAANPCYGHYNDKFSPQDNVRLPESIMTRFDMVFITLDNKGMESDGLISTHVLNTHRQINTESENVISQELFRDYILYAKSLRPKLSREAGAAISSAYSELRGRKNDKNLIINITPRLLETMIRMATANAKLRLSEVVSEEDAIDAIKMVNDNIFYRKATIVKQSKVNKESVKNTDENINSNIIVKTRKEKDKNVDLSEERREMLVDILWEWREKNMESEFCDILSLVRETNKENKEKKVTEEEMEQLALELSSQDIVLYADGKIYFLD